MDNIDFEILNIIFEFNVKFNRYPRAFEVAKYFKNSYLTYQFIRNRLKRLVKRKILLNLENKAFKPNVAPIYYINKKTIIK